MTDPIVRTYLVSNSAAYLFRELRKLPGVRRLAELEPTQALFERIRAVDQAEARTVDSVAQAYAAIVALTLQSPAKVRETVGDYQFKQLQWAGELLARWLASAVGSSSQAFRASPKLIEASGQDRRVHVGKSAFEA